MSFDVDNGYSEAPASVGKSYWIIAHVKDVNIASTKTLLRAGFHESEKIQSDVRCFKHSSSLLM